MTERVVAVFEVKGREKHERDKAKERVTKGPILLVDGCS